MPRMVAAKMARVRTDPRDPSLARGLVVAFLLSFGPAVSNSFARFAYALVLPAMRADLDWNYSQAGSINTVNALGYLAGALAVRTFVGRLGNRALFGWGMLVTSAAIAATGMVRDFEALMAVLSLHLANHWPQTFSQTRRLKMVGNTPTRFRPSAPMRKERCAAA